MEQNGLISSDINTLTTEIIILKQQTAQNIIEIGKRLIAVKEKLPHGEWGKWLREKVDFSHSSANRFMQVAREFSNSPALGNLPPTKVFALLDLPPEEREEFVQSNPVDEMTTRELQQAIKEKAELKKKLEAAEKRAQQESERAKRISESYNRLEETNKKHYQKSEELRKMLDDTKRELAKAMASGDSEEVKRLQKLLEKMSCDLEESNQRIKELERQLKEKPIETTATQVIEKVPDEVQKELEELRKSQQSSAGVLKFTVYFDELVKCFQNLLGALAEVESTDKEMHEKYKKAVSGLIGKMSERL